MRVMFRLDRDEYTIEVVGVVALVRRETVDHSSPPDPPSVEELRQAAIALNAAAEALEVARRQMPTVWHGG